LEIAGLAATDVLNHTAFHYIATQTVLQEGKSLLSYYGKMLSGQATELIALSHFVVDAYFPSIAL
jgi:hypothetical protein